MTDFLPQVLGYGNYGIEVIEHFESDPRFIAGIGACLSISGQAEFGVTALHNGRGRFGYDLRWRSSAEFTLEQMIRRQNDFYAVYHPDTLRVNTTILTATEAIDSIGMWIPLQYRALQQAVNNKQITHLGIAASNCMDMTWLAPGEGEESGSMQIHVCCPDNLSTAARLVVDTAANNAVTARRVALCLRAVTNRLDGLLDSADQIGAAVIELASWSKGSRLRQAT